MLLITIAIKIYDSRREKVGNFGIKSESKVLFRWER
jgi:hypothetical protein